MRTIVLASAAAPRLGALGERIPGCLLRVGGVPILRRALATHAAAGVREALVVTGHLADEVRHAVQGWHLPLAVTFVDNPRFATTGGEYALHLAAPWAAGAACFLHEADLVFGLGVLAALAAAPGGGLARCTGSSGGIVRLPARLSAQLFATIAARLGRGLEQAGSDAALDELGRAGTRLATVDVAEAYLAAVRSVADLERVDAEVRGFLPGPTGAPRVSIVVVGGASRARAAIVHALLGEPGADFEVVLAAGRPSSTPALVALPLDERLRPVCFATSEPALGRALGREAARGAIVVELDAGELAHADRHLAGLAVQPALELLRRVRLAGR